MAQQNMASAGLPEKNWFKLDEIAERWGCSVDLLTHYAETGMLRVCANFRRVTGIKVALRSNANGEITAFSFKLNVPVAGIFEIPAEEIAPLNRHGRVLPRGLYELDAKYTTAASACSFDEELLEEVEGWRDCIVTADTGSMWCKGGEQRPVWLYGPPPVDYVTKGMLLVTRVERDRFEKQQGMGAHAGEMPSDVAPGEVVETESMRLLLQASREFWSTSDPEEPTTHSSNEDVVKWLKEQGMSERLAGAVATIIRPGWAHAGRRKK